MDTDGCHGVLPIIITDVDIRLYSIHAGTCPELQVDTSLDILQAGTCPELQVDTSLEILHAGTCLGLQVDTSLDILQAQGRIQGGGYGGCNPPK